MAENNSIVCPQCGAIIDIEDALFKQFDELHKKKYEERQKELEQEHRKKLIELQEKQESFTRDKEEYDQKLKTALAEQMKDESAKIRKSIQDEFTNQYQDQIKAQDDELKQKTEQLKDMNKAKAELERVKREKDELEEKITLQAEIKLNAKLAEEKERVHKQLEENTARIKMELEEASLMKIEELKKQRDDTLKQVEELKRKAEQGSQQLQGEVQELAIEEILKSLFPIDEISEVPKGIKGPDVIHKVINRLGAECGTIVYESKRTKSFGNDWISKLKNDAIPHKASICIIVSEVLPDNTKKIHNIDGVWVCSFHDFKDFVFVIRENLIKISEAFDSQTNKGEKMQMLYDYLTSNEFSLQMEAIVEGFLKLRRSYQQERTSMERIWKQREKQLERILLNTNHFIGSIKGIAGITIQGLELIESDENLIEQLD